MTPTLSVRARFERFPATLKGAFILRGEDPNPHQVVLGSARIVPVTGGDGHPIPIAESTLDIAPKQDVFVPFEVGVTDLEPGWYDVECELDVDGVHGAFPGGKRFAVAWPRASTRRGSVRIGQVLKLGGSKFAFDRLECAPDHATLRLTATPPAEAEFALAADDDDVPVLDVERDERSGSTSVTVYPVLKTQSTLRIEVRASGETGSLTARLA